MTPYARTAIRTVTTLVRESRREIAGLADALRGLRPYLVALALLASLGAGNLWLRTECRQVQAEIQAHSDRIAELRELRRKLVLESSMREGVEHLERAVRVLGLESGARSSVPGGR